MEFISRIKDEFSTASHNCWAYLVGPPGSTDRIGLSDDGEPHGTAGKPMLTALQYSGLGDLTAVVTRFFGGAKLGTGGLVKAYTLAVKNALEQVRTREKIDWLTLTITLDYSLLERLKLCLGDHEAEILDTAFAEQVTLTIRLPAEERAEFRRRLDDLSAGQIKIKG